MHSNTGPWNLDELIRPPVFAWGETYGRLREIYCQNEAWQGRPTRFFGYLAVPEQVPRHGVPAMLLIHGGGGRAFDVWAAAWAERGYAALAIDLGGGGPGPLGLTEGAAGGKDLWPRLPDAGPPQDHPAKFSAIAAGVREAWSYHAVAAAIRGISLLSSLPEVDPALIGVTGISWGGYLTCLVAGLDPRPRLFIPVYGCGFLRHNSVWLPEFDKLGAELAALWNRNFDPQQYLPNARAASLWLNGTNDFAYPPDSHDLSCRAAGGAVQVRLEVRMPHSHISGWTPVEIARFADQHLRGGRPLPKLGTVSRRDNQMFAPMIADSAIAKAEMHFTTDSGCWQERAWQNVPAQLTGGIVTGSGLPKNARAAFLSVTDLDGFMTSTMLETIVH